MEKLNKKFDKKQKKSSNLKNNKTKEKSINENEKLTKQLVTVKFSFDENDGKTNENLLNNNKIDETIKIDENLNENNNRTVNSGNYDELPLIKIEEVEEFDRKLREQSIPKYSNFHDEKFITLTAKNVGSKIHDPESQKPIRFDKSVQLLYQRTPTPVNHNFGKLDQLDGKMCQICHHMIRKKTAVTCGACGLVCHEDCADSVSFYFYFF